MRAALLAFALAMPMAALAQTNPAPAPAPAPASTVIEQSPEYRYQIDFAVNAAALAKMLPAGWEANPAAMGPAKDCNLRMIFIDRMNIVGADGKVAGSGTNRLVYLAIPVKKTGGTETGQIIISGITEKVENANDAFGVLIKASKASMSRSITSTLATEDWDFAAASGEHMSLHVKFEPFVANRAGGETKFYNPKDPTKYQLFRTEQATDISRNVTTTPQDRVKEFSYKAGGGKIAALFDGTEKVLSWDSQRWYTRTISAPAP